MFPRVESEQEIIYEDSKPNFRSVSCIPGIHIETCFHIPREELHKTYRITHAYAKLIGKLPIAFELSRRKSTCVQHPNTYIYFYIKSIDDLIKNALQEIPGPLGRAAHFLVEPEDELEGEHPKITLIF